VVNPENLRADKLLDDIRKERNRASREREKSEKARSKIDEQNTTLATRLEKIEDERRKILEQARAEAELETAVLTQQIETLREQLKKARQPLDAIKSIEEQAQVIEEKVTKSVDRRPLTVDRQQSTTNRQLSLGDKVFLQTIQAEGVITALGKSDAEVQIGSLRVRAKLNELQRPNADDRPQTVDSKKKEEMKKASTVNRLSPTGTSSSTVNAPGMELDLRGQNAEDALSMLDNYLDRAYIAGMPYVRIIHGKGTGKLRQSVREMLKGHAHVKSYEEGLPNEGGDGVTVAKILNG
jgi:DNA mismatch repair protein MutS2